MGLSLPHILIFAVIAVLLLGGGRFSAMMGDVAKGVKNFKRGMSEEDAPAPGTPTPLIDAKPEVRTEAQIIADYEARKAAEAAAQRPDNTLV